MLKKHDKYTGRYFKPIFDLEIQKHPFYSFPFDPMIIKLSKLYDVARHGTKRNEDLSSAGGKQQDFVRKTIKYWVHPDNVMEVKCIILKHLPVLVFAKGTQEPDPAISSVYFDNESFELYLGRLEKSEGAQAIRFRWYGRAETAKEVFIERKTHHEDWTGEPSVKQRVPIKEKDVRATRRPFRSTLLPLDFVDERLHSRQVQILRLYGKDEGQRHQERKRAGVKRNDRQRGAASHHDEEIATDGAHVL